MSKFFETASFHIVKPCNMKCKFCYATFQDMHVINQLPKKDAFTILDKLKEAGLEKITFAGGEPMLYRWIEDVIRYSKSIGLTTSLITNGSFFTNENIVKWVSVEDALPEFVLHDKTTSEKVIIRFDGFTTIGSLYKEYNGKENVWFTMDDTFNEQLGLKVTHWRTLPTAP